MLFDVDPSDVKGPLTSFQATRFIREDFKRLVSVINSAADDQRLDPPVLDSVFDMWWPKLEDEVSAILKISDKTTKKERRSERDILEELLDLTRMSSHRLVRPRISERAVTDLIESLDELQFILHHENEEIGLRILKRLDRPLRHICIEAGVPEMYERFRKRFVSRPRVPLDTAREDSVEEPVDTAEPESTRRAERGR